MQTGSGCTGGVTGWNGYVHTPGDRFIFKGGTTWPAACFGMTIPSSGVSSSNPDYYGVDLSWFTGSAFAQPKIDLAQTNVGDTVIHITGNFVELDDFEITNQNVQNANSGTNTCNGAAICVPIFSSGQWIMLTRMLIHNFMTTREYTNARGQGPQYQGGGVFGYAILDHSTIEDSAGFGFNSNGVKVLGGIGGACVNCQSIQYSTMHDGIGASFTVILNHDDEFYNYNQTIWDTAVGSGGYGLIDAPNFSRPHTQVIENDFTAAPYGETIYNCYIHDTTNVGVTIYVPYSSTIYNNVLYNTKTPIQLQHQYSGDSASNVGYIYNNTVDCSNGFDCVKTDAKTNGPDGLGTLFVKNNLWITNGTATCFSPDGTCFRIATITTDGSGGKNYTMSTTEAASFGFTAARKYAPSSSDTNVTGAGFNLSPCTGSLAPLCSDTEGAPWYAGTSTARPSSPTNWTLGAYAWPLGTGGGGSHPPVVSVTAPVNGATVSGMQPINVNCTATNPATIASIQIWLDGIKFGVSGTASPFSQTFNTTTSYNGNHSIYAICTDSNSLSTQSTTITVKVSNSLPNGCFISGSNLTGMGFNQFVPISAQTGSFVATVGPVTPNTNDQDSVIALSNAPMTAYAQGATLFRFNSSGNIDAWSQAFGNYTAVNTAPYAAGTPYFFQWSVNIPAGTYSLTETSPNSVVIASGYLFRSTAIPSPLGYLNAISDNTTPDTVKVCGFAINGTPGALVLSPPTSLSIGSVNLTSTGTGSVSVTVTGNPVTISSVAISGTNMADFTIGPGACSGIVGASCSIPINFIPSLVGSESATLTITSNGTGSPQTIALSGTGVAQASVSPTSLAYGTVNDSNSVTLQTTLTNSGNGTLSSIVVSYSGNSQFVLGSATGTDCRSTSSLTVGQSCNIALVFTPTSATTFTGTISIASSMTGSPLTVAATGTGVATSPGLSLSPTSLAFGSLPVSLPSALSVAGTTSGGTVNFTSVVVSGTNAADFVIGTNTCTGSGVSSCVIPITFTASIVGSESATLTVTSNAAGSPQTVALTGTGTTQGTLSASSLAFGTVLVGNTSVLGVTFTNNGGADLTSAAVSYSGNSEFTLVAPPSGASDCRTLTVFFAATSCDVGVQFAPDSATSFTGTVSIASSMIGSPLTVSLTGSGMAAPTPVLTFNITNLNFGPYSLTGGSLPIGIIATASGGSVTFTGTPAVSGTNAADFPIQTNGCSGTISSGANCTLTISFIPSIIGPESAVLTYTDNATGSPQTINLAGSGAPQASITPGSITFGNVNVKSISQLSVTLTNSGALPLTSIVVSYSGNSQFTLSPASGADCRSIISLPAGSSCTVAVQFLPTSATSFSGTLTITSSMSGSPLTLAVTGSGTFSAQPTTKKLF